MIIVDLFGLLVFFGLIVLMSSGPGSTILFLVLAVCCLVFLRSKTT